MRTAASMLVLANGPATQHGRLRVLMIKRHTKARFMANLYVFPGGVLETEDGAVTDSNPIGPFRRAALRELWEETSVALDGNGAAVGRAVSPDYSLSESITPFAHWLTPLNQKYRYDTWFFAHSVSNDEAALSLDMQQCPREVADLRWIAPREALSLHKKWEQSGFCLSPPTWCLVDWLAQYDGSEDFIAAVREKYGITPPGATLTSSLQVTSSVTASVSHHDVRLAQDTIPSVLTSYREFNDGTSSVFIDSNMVHLPDGKYPNLIYDQDMVYVGKDFEEEYLSASSSGLK